MNTERTWCLVPDCDEQPWPGDTVCETHQREQFSPREKHDDDGREYGHPRDRKEGRE